MTIKFSFRTKNLFLGKNENVNSLETPAIKSHKDSKTNSLQGLTHAPNFSHKKQEPHTITHNEEKIAFVLALTGARSEFWGWQAVSLVFKPSSLPPPDIFSN